MRRLVVGFVVDSSSSMESRKRQVIESYNEYLGTIAKEPAEVRVTRTHFDDDVRVEHGVVPLVAAPRLTTATYRTEGSTALYDGLGETIKRLEREVGPEDRVTVVLLTDGEENMSKQWRLPALNKLVKQKEATGLWTFIMLGANVIDVGGIGRKLGFLPGNVLSFDVTDAGIAAAFDKVTEGTVRLLTDGSDASKTFFAGE